MIRRALLAAFPIRSPRTGHVHVSVLTPPSEESHAAHYRGAVRWLDWYGDSTLYVLDVALACCALEFDAAATGAPAVTDPPPGARTAVVCKSLLGKAHRLAPAVVSMVDGIRARQDNPPTVISFGVCACSGGPYWDSYAVTKGVDTLLEVDMYVPGCPPPPEALRAVLDEVSGRAAIGAAV